MNKIKKSLIVITMGMMFSTVSFAGHHNKDEHNEAKPVKEYSEKKCHGKDKYHTKKYNLTPEQKAEKLNKKFSKIDKDQDGFISKEEFFNYKLEYKNHKKDKMEHNEKRPHKKYQ